MAGALGSTVSGLALAGPQMLKWIKGVKLATIAQKAFNFAMRLNPIGLVVTALVLAGLAIWKFRDEIKEGFGQVVRFAKDLYIGVKTWLTDKLGAIFDGVKAKVDAVTGFFGNMYDKVVGNSIVPDMVNRIGVSFVAWAASWRRRQEVPWVACRICSQDFSDQGGEFSLTTIMGGAKGLFQNTLASTLKSWCLPLVGPLLSQFGPALMEGIGKLAGKVWGSLKRLFGGPDGMEQEGRRAAEAARDAISHTLTDGQIKEAAGDAAAAVHIAVRDATLKAGKSLAEAERAASRWVAALHRAEKEGGSAVDAVKDKILALLQPQDLVIAKTFQMAEAAQAYGITAVAAASKAAAAFSRAAVGGGTVGGDSSYNKHSRRVWTSDRRRGLRAAESWRHAPHCRGAGVARAWACAWWAGPRRASVHGRRSGARAICPTADREASFRTMASRARRKSGRRWRRRCGGRRWSCPAGPGDRCAVPKRATARRAQGVRVE